MSFLDRPTVPFKFKIGCLLYVVTAVAVSGFLLVGAAMGDCAPNMDGSGCEHDGLVRFAMFPGSLILFVVGGIFLAHTVLKGKS